MTFTRFYLLEISKTDLQRIIYTLKRTISTMILYYNNPDNQNEKTNVYIDFHTLHNRVKRQFPESKLYRLLRKRCSPYRYQNRDLWSYEEIVHIPEIYKEMKRDDYENPNI